MYSNPRKALYGVVPCTKLCVYRYMTGIKKCRLPGTFCWLVSEVAYMVCVKVRVMTSICCSLVSELNRTA